MGRWSDNSIKWISAVLTTSYDDNFITLVDVRTDEFVLYVDYVKGTEGFAEVQVFYDNSNRLQLGADEWYGRSSDGYWPAATEGVDVTGGFLPGENMPFRLAATGKYRFKLLKFPRENHVKIACRTTTPGSTPGTVGLRWAGGEIGWGGVGQGEE